VSFFTVSCRYLTLQDAQSKALRVDWSDPANKPVKPKLLGTHVLADYPIEELVKYIDWNPFFQVGARSWQGWFVVVLDWVNEVCKPLC
jgi:cobalamin-dependent methionine synthase I